MAKNIKQKLTERIHCYIRTELIIGTKEPGHLVIRNRKITPAATAQLKAGDTYLLQIPAAIGLRPTMKQIMAALTIVDKQIALTPLLKGI